MPGVSVIGFDSAEEMEAYMVSEEKHAMENTMDEQWAIPWGGYVFRITDGLAIWAHIFSEREFLAENSKPGQGPDEEILYELDGLKAAHELGYRYGRWHSEVVPEGEYGSAHVVSLWPITKQDFEAARENGWKLWEEIARRINEETQEAIRNHEKGMKDEGDS